MAEVNFQKPIPMRDNGYDRVILFVDVMTEPWKNPFILVNFMLIRLLSSVV